MLCANRTATAYQSLLGLGWGYTEREKFPLLDHVRRTWNKEVKFQKKECEIYPTMG